MRRKSNAVWWALGAGVGLVVAYEVWKGSSPGVDVITLSPGTSANLPIPPNNEPAAFRLPAGARGWVAASSGLSASVVPTALPLPSGTADLVVPNIVPGELFAMSWIDSNGATQATLLGFAAPAPTPAIQGLAALRGYDYAWHPLMRPG